LIRKNHVSVDVIHEASRSYYDHGVRVLKLSTNHCILFNLGLGFLLKSKVHGENYSHL